MGLRDIEKLDFIECNSDCVGGWGRNIWRQLLGFYLVQLEIEFTVDGCREMEKKGYVITQFLD